MSLLDNLQENNPQEPIHQPAHPEKKKARPPWVNALIIVGVLTIFMLWFALVAYLAIEVFHERSSAEPTEVTEVQEESATRFREVIATQSTSSEWDSRLNELADVLEQDLGLRHVSDPGSWGPTGALRTSTFVTERQYLRQVNLFEFESKYAAAQGYRDFGGLLSEGQFEGIDPIVIEKYEFAFEEMRGITILLGNYIFDSFLDLEDHEQYIVPLIDRLEHEIMVAEDPIKEFRETILAKDRFGDYDSGFIQNAVFHNDVVTVTLYEKFDDSGKVGFLERIMMRDPLEYQIVEDGSHVHFWTIEDWGGSDNMYLVSIYHQNFLYEFTGEIRHREAIDRVISQLGF